MQGVRIGELVAFASKASYVTIMSKRNFYSKGDRKWNID